MFDFSSAAAAAAEYGGSCGAADFLAVARQYRTVVLADVPLSGAAQRDAALHTFLDILYEATRCSSAPRTPLPTLPELDMACGADGVDRTR